MSNQQLPWSVSTKWFNLWRRYPFEPRSRAYIRGTVFMVAILILLGFTTYTIQHALNPSTLYARRSFRRLTNMPQPNIFTNHCDSAMMPGADENVFASLITVHQQCDTGVNGWFNGAQQIADCNPVWYKIIGNEQECSVFNDFHGVPGKTTRCLAFECPLCSSESSDLIWYNTTISLSYPPVDGTSIWSPDVANLIGTTAIWPWNNASNPKNGKNPKTGEERCIPADAVRSTPFLAQNGTHMSAVATYTESGSTVTNPFRDFIGLPNQWEKYATYGAIFITPARQDSDILPGDASFVLRRWMWAQWDASEDYTASTLPLLIGSIGGLFAAFTGALAAIFGTSVGFIFFGSKPISIKPLLPIGRRKASQNLKKHYFPTVDGPLNAFTAYLADFIVDTGEFKLDLTQENVSGQKRGENEHELPFTSDSRRKLIE